MGSPINVLVIEDDDVEIMAMKRALKGSHTPHTLSIARDGIEALAKLRGEGCAPLSRPYVIFLDLNMPRMTGLEFLRELRRDPVHAAANVVVVTTSGAEEDKRAAFTERVSGYVVKSNYVGNFQAFASEIEAYVRMSHAANDETRGPERILILAGDGPAGALVDGLRARNLLTEAVDDVPAAVNEVTHNPYDCIVVDAALPEERLFSLLAQINEQSNDIPAVLLMAQTINPEIAARAIREGADDWVTTSLSDGDRIYQAIVCAFERARRNRRFAGINSRLERLVSLDPLTELLNRRGLDRALSSEQARAKRGGTPLLALLADCDDFRRVNELYGYAAGDLVLREVANRITAVIRRSDHAGRIGGDQFLILLPGASQSVAETLVERVRMAITDTPISIGAETVRQTTTISVIHVSPEAHSITEMLNGAG